MTLSEFLSFPVGLDVESVSANEEHIVITAIAHCPSGRCPLCQQEMVRVHSRYRRTVADLPCAGRRVVLSLLMRKFFCDTAQCPRRIFTERLPDFVEPWARITNRLCDSLEAIGFATSGEAGSRLAPQVGMAVAPTTLLRRIMEYPIPAPHTVSHAGIDDFAFRRGRKYGTILIDLDRHQVIGLLPDRTVDGTVAWLCSHSQITVISRDRGTDYATAARQALPQAVQVADRFHILKNLVEVVELVLAGQRAAIRKAYQPEPPDEAKPEGEAAPLKGEWKPLLSSTAEQARGARHAQRLDRYQQIVQLRAQKLSMKEIARRLGMGERTIGRWLAQGTAPEVRHRRKERSHFDAYAAYVLQRWQEGCHNGLQLWRELQQQGYPDGPSMVYRFLAVLRTGEIPALPDFTEPRSTKPRKKVAEPVPSVPLEHFSAHTAVWWFVRNPEALDESERRDLAFLRQGSSVAENVYQLTQDFVQILHKRQGERLDQWLEQARASAIPEIQRFVTGVERDKAAVVAGLTLPYSNGVVEGHVHRLKLIKRMMYGRANFPLLRQRVLYAA